MPMLDAFLIICCICHIVLGEMLMKEYFFRALPKITVLLPVFLVHQLIE
jgi:hypothetical protein